MKKTFKNICVSLLFFLLFILVLASSKETKQLSSLAISIWFEHLIPALFPFMFLSGFIIDLHIDQYVIIPFVPILKIVYRINISSIYVIVVGFLCGFPLGAKVCMDQYNRGKISQTEAEFLLCFCNNFGPAYYIIFVKSALFVDYPIIKGLLLIYGIPLMYAFILRYTLYRNMKITSNIQNSDKEMRFHINTIISAIYDNIVKSLSLIGILGGYMIICNVLFLIPQYIFHHIFHISNAIPLNVLHCLLEISGGISLFKTVNVNKKMLFTTIHTLLAFNGLSCHLQTFILFDQRNFSKKKYMLHKIILCSITFLIANVLCN